MSEPLRSSSDDADPELVPVVYDDAAMLEYLHEMGPDLYGDEYE